VDPAQGVRLNVKGTANVLEAARRCGVKRVVMASSKAAYETEFAVLRFGATIGPGKIERHGGNFSRYSVIIEHGMAWHGGQSDPWFPTLRRPGSAPADPGEAAILHGLAILQIVVLQYLIVFVAVIQVDTDLRADDLAVLLLVGCAVVRRQSWESALLMGRRKAAYLKP
jgi:hypothetical protein